MIESGTNGEIDASLRGPRPTTARRTDRYPDAYFTGRRQQIVDLSARLGAISYSPRDWAVSGALMSYGTDIAQILAVRRGLRRAHSQGREACRPAGDAADQIRAGLNLKTAKTLGLEVPPKLLAPPTR